MDIQPCRVFVHLANDTQTDTQKRDCSNGHKSQKQKLSY